MQSCKIKISVGGTLAMQLIVLIAIMALANGFKICDNGVSYYGLVICDNGLNGGVTCRIRLTGSHIRPVPIMLA